MFPELEGTAQGPVLTWAYLKQNLAKECFSNSILEKAEWRVLMGAIFRSLSGYAALKSVLLESRDFRKNGGMCYGLPPGPSVTPWDIPTLSLLGCGEVQTRKPSFWSALGPPTSFCPI